MKKFSVKFIITFATAATAILFFGVVRVSQADVVPPPEETPAEATAATKASPAPLPVAATPKKAGAQIWAENCSRCHNMREPASFSDREWDLIMHHMRVRANLTAEEYESIRKFLKSANN